MRALMMLRILAKPPEIQGFQTISHSYQNTFDRGVVFASFPLASGIGAGFVGPIINKVPRTFQPLLKASKIN